MDSASGADDKVEIVKVVTGGKRRLFDEFKHKNHSLSINASSVAACVGYHEFQSIPELMLQHVYQGGQDLLEHDAKLLGLELLTQEQSEAELLQIAESSGSSQVLQSFQKALRIKRQHDTVMSVEEANKLKTTIAKHATKLTPHHSKLLQEATRQAIDTGCGHSWEEEALDRYEQTCGWEVRERNAECRVWDFEKTTNTDVPSIRPLGPARARRNRHRVSNSSTHESFDNNKSSNHRYDSRGVKRKLPSSYDSQISETALMDLTAVKDSDSEENTVCRDGKDKEDIAMVTIDGMSTEQTDIICIDNDENDNPHERNHISRPQNHPKPFVTIKGMVDGIRDELGPTNQSENDDDDDLSCGSFSLSRVVVECKHRMNKLLPNGPRFSECIQAVVYCFMYESDDADIVQVLRHCSVNAKTDNQQPLVTNFFKKAAPSVADGGVQDETSDKVTEATKESSSDEANIATAAKDGEVKDNSKTEAAAVETITKPVEDNSKNDVIDSSITMKIAVDRVSLDDPNYGHRANWKAVILPKLRQWVDAVYEIRQSDDKRYRLLSALSTLASSSSNEGEQEQLIRKNHAKAAWELVFEECDFLREGMSGERYRRETQ